MYRYSQQGDATTVFRVTVPAQTLTTSSNYVTLTGDTDIKLRGISDMVTRAGQIHNYSIDYRNRLPFWTIRRAVLPQVRDSTISEAPVQ